MQDYCAQRAIGTVVLVRDSGDSGGVWVERHSSPAAADYANVRKFAPPTRDTLHEVCRYVHACIAGAGSGSTSLLCFRKVDCVLQRLQLTCTTMCARRLAAQLPRHLAQLRLCTAASPRAARRSLKCAITMQSRWLS